MGGGASTLPSAAKLRRLIFIKLHNAKKDGEKRTVKVRLAETFAQYDSDGNGSITSDEFKMAVLDFGIAGISGGQLDQLVAMFDHDGDGKISYDEFQEFVKGEKPVETTATIQQVPCAPVRCCSTSAHAHMSVQCTGRPNGHASVVRQSSSCW
jgi:Ca2+-binding EF-hand superfamily protein